MKTAGQNHPGPYGVRAYALAIGGSLAIIAAPNVVCAIMGARS